MSEQVESGTVAPTAAAVTSAENGPAVISSLSAADLTAARDLVLKANPTAIPELLTGSTLAELTASAETSSEIYNRIINNVQTAAAGETEKPAPVSVPAGGTAPVDLTKLPTAELIKRGVAARRAS